jgi:SAM-dependent methyltransferase
MPDDAPEGAHEADANRDLWTRVSVDYADEHAFRAWASNEITWGIFNIPENQLDVLGDVSGLNVVELGCGTAYFSAWLARRGARPVGLDLTPAQLATARRRQEHFGLPFPLLEADAGHVPLRARRFDLVISECGASLWCDPARWIPEAARILRPGGRLVFHTTSVLLAMCQPGVTGYAGYELLQPQREVSRLQSPGHGIQFHPSHSEWIKILRAAGFAIDALHELYAPPEASTHPYYKLATAEWARRWPVEEIWVAHLAAESMFQTHGAAESYAHSLTLAGLP